MISIFSNSLTNWWGASVTVCLHIVKINYYLRWVHFQLHKHWLCEAYVHFIHISSLKNSFPPSVRFVLPPSSILQCTAFLDHYRGKISKIYKQFSTPFSSLAHIYTAPIPYYCLSFLLVLFLNLLLILIFSSASLILYLPLSCVTDISTPIIISLSLASGSISIALKSTVILPVLKKKLALNHLYWTISDLLPPRSS